ncbi:hypothetical protein M9H77_19545 [Catharanthus roseus]|uniref:Uncharacterized protein n=1 Tax=Catharanthus roseus TaxID=4058 RepID=A0ACC0BAM0_CATRO|nr:hypothetical protein M9H77_19545 [Catharanthus roseus]
MEFSLTTAAVKTDGGNQTKEMTEAYENQTKEMTEAKQMNGHRADERSPSSGNEASRHRTCKGEEEDQQGTETQRTQVERGAAAALQREKAEEPEKSSIRTQRDRKKYNEETVKRRRGRDCTRNEEARV